MILTAAGVQVGVVMTSLTAGLQLAAGVLVRPATWKFKPSLVSFVSLSGLSLAVSMALSPLVVAFCKVYHDLRMISITRLFPRESLLG